MSAPAATLEEVIRSCGEGWIIDSFAPSGGLERIRALIDQANTAMARRQQIVQDPITDSAIIDGYRRSPHKIHAFIQALGQTESPELLVLVWRILDGMEIQEIQMAYRLKSRFHLEITLVPSTGEHPEIYHSHDIDDAALLRHLGIMKIDDLPVFDGFYPVPWAI